MATSDTPLLPPELFDTICFHVNDPTDLLSISLSCQFLAGVVIPNHLYRRIRSDLRPASYWKGLKEVGSVVRHIRSLEIVPVERYRRPDERLPPSITIPVSGWEYSEQEVFSYPYMSLEGKTAWRAEATRSMQALADVIRCMPSLTHFSWLTHVRPDNVIFEALSELGPNVCEIEVQNWESRHISPGLDRSNLLQSKLWTLSDLTQFSYTDHWFEQWDDQKELRGEFASRLLEMLVNRCPNLEDLQLSFIHKYQTPMKPTHMVQTYLDQAHWPNLKRFSVDDSLYNAYTTNFFSRHPTIEALYVWTRIPYIRKDNFPSLTSLECEFLSHRTAISDEVARDLQHLDLLLDYRDDISKKRARKSFLPAACNLETLVLRSPRPHMMSASNMLEYLPSLEKLAFVFDWHLCATQHLSVRISSDPDSLSGPDAQNDAQLDKHFATILSELPRLTHFSPVYVDVWSRSPIFDPDAAEVDKIDVSLRRLLPFAPKLKCAGIISDEEDTPGHPPFWVVLERDDEGNYCGYHRARAPRVIKDTNPDLWGNIYHGAGKVLRHFSPILLE